MAKRKTKSSAQGDDPLAWIAKDATAEKIEVKETQPKKVNKKSTKKIQAVKKTKAKKAQTKKGRTKKRLKKHTHENNTSNMLAIIVSGISLAYAIVLMLNHDKSDKIRRSEYLLTCYLSAKYIQAVNSEPLMQKCFT